MNDTKISKFEENKIRNTFYKGCVTDIGAAEF